MPVLSERQNVVVMADEAHRSQYAAYAQNITRALPNATRIGFTGTPVEGADRSTRLVFGDYVSVYRMRQAQEDQATVPIYYESRQIPLSVEDQEQLAQVGEILEAEEQEAAGKLITSWAKLEKVVGSPERIETLANDIHLHFTTRCEALPGKATRRRVLEANCGRARRESARALRRGDGRLRDLRQRDRREADLAVPPL